MKYLNKFETTEDYNQAIGGGLSQLDNYVALTDDNQIVHLKPIPNIFYVTTNNSGTRIYKRTDNQYGIEKITLENGENKFTDWNYGFWFEYGMEQSQITSFDLTKYDTSNVTSMSQMFYFCRSLTSLDVSKFDTSKVTDMSEMFQYCTGLTSLDLSSFDTTNVTNMYHMFYYCSGLTSLDLSKFNTSKVTSMSQMFSSCNGLTHIKCKQAFKDWCIRNQDDIYLPRAMRDNGSGTWDIVDAQG